MARFTFSRRGKLGTRTKAFVAHITANAPELVRRGARLHAVALARYTQPYRGGAEGGSEEPNYSGETDRVMGEKAVSGDIRAVYATPRDVYAALLPCTDAKAPNPALTFYELLKQGKIKAAQKILDRNNTIYRGIPIANFDGGEALKARRNPRTGHVSAAQKAKPALIVKNPKRRESFLKKKLKLVGFGKGGWAACARQLGGTRGIPQWVTRHSGHGFVQDHSKDVRNPHVLITNGVNYVDRIINGNGIALARRESRGRLIKAIVREFKIARKKARSS